MYGGEFCPKNDDPLRYIPAPSDSKRWETAAKKKRRFIWFFVSEADVIVNVVPMGAIKTNAHTPATNANVARRVNSVTNLNTYLNYKN